MFKIGQENRVIIIGAGPAGLTCGYELSKQHHCCSVVEADCIVGGISRTVQYKGFRFDIGGHRFFTKVDYIRRLWQEMLSDDLQSRKRESRIFYNGRFFDYPLSHRNALQNLGLYESLRIFSSYIVAKSFPHPQESNFEQWVRNRFGKRLYEIFFKTYTEKVWGIPCHEISAEWAAQRIKNLSLTEALKNAIFNHAIDKKGDVITSLIDRFYYPRYGPGMMWERCRDKLVARGQQVDMDRKVIKLYRRHQRIERILCRSSDGVEQEYETPYLISSMPLRELILALDPPPPQAVLSAARALRYRDYFTVVLMVNKAHIFRDNWLYIHSPQVLMGRIQNYKNWSPEMVPDPALTSLGLEYFVWKEEPLWHKTDEELIELGISECVKIGLVDVLDVIDGTVVRMEKAYPVYDKAYHQHLGIIRHYLERFDNLQTIGRNGLHRYNNQDHSMLTGIYAARNIPNIRHNVWTVNTEKRYQEALDAGDKREKKLQNFLKQEFAYVDGIALGFSVAFAFSSMLLGITLYARWVSDVSLSDALWLLNNYFIGYTVSLSGAILGAMQAAMAGFILGYGFAFLRNWGIKYYANKIKKKYESLQSKNILT